MTLSRAEPYKADNDQWYLPYVEASLRRDRGEAGPCLVVYFSDEFEAELTLEEAARLAESLLAELRSAQRLVGVER